MAHRFTGFYNLSDILVSILDFRNFWAIICAGNTSRKKIFSFDSCFITINVIQRNNMNDEKNPSHSYGKNLLVDASILSLFHSNKGMFA